MRQDSAILRLQHYFQNLLNHKRVYENNTSSGMFLTKIYQIHMIKSIYKSLAPSITKGAVFHKFFSEHTTSTNNHKRLL